MSEFDELDDSEKIERLRRLSKAAFAIGVSGVAVLIGRGLVSPDEFSQLMKPILDLFEDLEEESDEDFAQVIEQLAKLKSAAARTWVGK